MSKDSSGFVRLLEVLDIFFRECDIHSIYNPKSISPLSTQSLARKHTDDLLEVLELRRAHNRRRDAVLRETPCDRDLSHSDALLLCELFDPVIRQCVPATKKGKEWRTNLATISGVPAPT